MKILTSSKQHKTIESVLERGEKLDNLVERSNALSAQSKMFYKTAKKVCHLFLSLSLSLALSVGPDLISFLSKTLAV